MGVHNDKRIEGFSLSRSQQQHIVLSIIDTFNHFTPPVPKHFYDITFIEVIDGKQPQDPLMKTLQLPPLRLRHSLRTEDFCWCDRQVRDLRNFFTDFQGRRWIIKLRSKEEIFRTNAPLVFFEMSNGETKSTNYSPPKPEMATTDLKMLQSKSHDFEDFNKILDRHDRVCLKIFVKRDELERSLTEGPLMRFKRTGKKWGKSRPSIV